ncbi:MAG: response regulator [Bryobacterales bacterium]|nr:response regulator [Bryobacterales bacterium]
MEYQALIPAHILLVEDNPADVRLAEIALEEARLQNPLSVVTNGEDAISYLKKEGRYATAPTPALVLLDLNLPRKSGYDVLREMRDDPVLRQIATIVLSGSPYEANALLQHRVDPRCYLVKPLDFIAFRQALASFERLGLAVIHRPPHSIGAGG